MGSKSRFLECMQNLDSKCYKKTRDCLKTRSNISIWVKMAQLDARKKSDSSKTLAAESFKTPRAQISPSAASFKTPRAQNSPPATSFKTPKSTTSPTFQQLLQGDATIWPSSPLGKHHDFEGLQSPSRKSRVISRVKEKAKKWRHSLSIKRRQSQSNESPSNQSKPSWGVSLDEHEDEEEEEEDPEYLGAPMYESALAPENYKETAKHHPRAVPLPSEKHVLESSVKNDVKKQENGVNSSKNMMGSVPGKLAPGSDATHTIASRFADLTVDTTESTDNGSSSKISPRESEVAKEGTSGTEKPESSMEGRVHGQSNSPSTWERGISVKEYLLKKLEPGEAEKALSQVITEKISPSRSPSEQVGMVERMKEAVTSFLRTDEASSVSETKTNIPSVNFPTSINANSSSEISSPSKKSPSPRKLVYTAQNPFSPNAKTNSSSQNTRFMTKAKSMSHANSTSAFKNTNSSSHVPMSKSSHAVPEEEKNGRILQPN